MNCTYCGDRHGDERDHVIPNSYLREGRAFRNDWTVPSCRECNQLLSDELFFDVPARASFLHGRYLTRYKKELKFKEWDPWELEDESDNIKAIILAAQWLKRDIESRLEHLSLVLQMDEDYLYPHK